MPSLFDPQLEKTFAEDRKFLERTKLPIITVSGTYTEDLKRIHHLADNETDRDIVFSRAHYTMALAIATQAWGDKIDPAKAWVVDPTNYVNNKDWFSVNLTESIGKTLARHSFLKLLKDFVDKFGRNKLPILESITPPLLYLTEKVQTPVLSFHIACGNILASQGKHVLQVITDPHVRYDYLTHAENPKMYFCVFDEATKLEFLEKAAIMNLKADASRIIVTGPPIDPRIIKMREKKNPWRSGPLKLCITTGGLGTNKAEIETLLKQLLPELRKKEEKFRIVVYAGTHQDIAQMVTDMATAHRVSLGDADERSAKLRVLYHPQLINANELLMKYGFPWAHGFISKPSGDMAYDCVASGSFLLTLQEWGEWEHNIRSLFEQKDISRKAAVNNIVEQLSVLMSAQSRSQSWIESAMHLALRVDKLMLSGAKNIVAAHKKLTIE
jgi:hypothetical protein